MNILGKPLFYHPSTLTDEFTLSEDESRHCVSSLRHKEQDSIFITNGEGTILNAVITKANPKACLVRVVEKETLPRHKTLRRLIVAPPKTGEKLDLIVEKAAEIGVDEIIFIETRYAERDKINLDRLHKIAVSAIKQSKQAYLPTLKGMVKWKSLMEEEIKGTRYIAAIADQHDSSIVSKHLAHELADSQSITHNTQVTILIGPEGDFSEDEVKTAIQKGFVTVSLGKNILRTETAALYALSLVNGFV